MSAHARKVLQDTLEWEQQQHDALEKRIAEDRATIEKNQAVLAESKRKIWGIKEGLRKLDPHADDFAKAV